MGLAKSYADQKGDYSTPKIIWGFLFVVGAGGIALTGLATVGDVKGVETAVTSILSKSTFYLAFIWLSSFATKQYKKNKRLEEEYAYKEALSKSYQGHKREVEDQGKEEISKKLNETLIDAIERNPSDLMSEDVQTERPGLTEKIKELTDAVNTNKN